MTSERVISLRVDESLYFANAKYLEEVVHGLMLEHPRVEHLVLQCPAVNHIDMSALESLETINNRLRESGVTLHFSEIKGPVMDRLKRSDLLEHLTGQVFLSHYQAISALAPEVVAEAEARFARGEAESHGQALPMHATVSEPAGR